MQKSNEKKPEKAGAGCQTSPFAISFLFAGKKSKGYFNRKDAKFRILNNGLRLNTETLKYCNQGLEQNEDIKIFLRLEVNPLAFLIPSFL